MSVKNILVVCTGNICRSPLGESLMDKSLSEKNGEKHNTQVQSAGIGALVGHPADPMAIAIGQKLGVNLEGHRGRQCSRDILISSELILTMEHYHSDFIYDMAPECRGRVFLFGYWQDRTPIPDPYKKDIREFQKVGKMISESVKSWVERL